MGLRTSGEEQDSGQKSNVSGGKIKAGKRRLSSKMRDTGVSNLVAMIKGDVS